MRTSLFVLVLICAVLWPQFTPAFAQSREDRADARQAFTRGIEFADAGEWRDAVAAFERAYDLVDAPEILFNLAGAQVQVERFLQASVSYRKLIHNDAAPEQLRDAAKKALEELERKVPKVRIIVEGLLLSDEVQLDDGPADVGGAPMAVDPGRHDVRVRRGGETVATDEFRVEAGEEKTVRLTIDSDEAPPPARSSGEGRDEPGDEGSFFTSTGFYAVAGLVVLGALVGGAIALTASGT